MKKIFIKVLRYLCDKNLFIWLPERYYIKFFYYINTNKKLNLKNPKGFNDKLNWLKLNYKDPLYIKCADKYLVRKYIEDLGHKEILTKLYGVYRNVNEINFEELPNKFVLKINHGCGFNIICKNKKSLNIDYTKAKLNNWLSKKYGRRTLEWMYDEIEPRIICEEFLEDKSEPDLKDYKFMCFNGKPLFVLVCFEREVDLKMNFYDMEWKLLPFKRKGHENTSYSVEPPKNLNKMIEIAKDLAKAFSFVRVDFYEVNGKIYFGELTFFPVAGVGQFDPVEWDDYYGDKLQLPEKLN